jgi:hypothetical protein
MDISRRWSEAQAPETSRQGVAPRMGHRTKNSCVPAGTRKIFYDLSRWLRFAPPPATFRRPYRGAK